MLIPKWIPARRRWRTTSDPRAGPALMAMTAWCACGGDASSVTTPPPGDTIVDVSIFDEVSATHLPGGLGGLSMDAAVADLDGDGDLDIVVAMEFATNVLLLNDGGGRFTSGSARLPQRAHDSEDIAIADFDGDGDLDVVIVSEDDETNEFYRNDGNAFFSDEGSRIPVGGVSNAVVTADLTGDGREELVLGNAGQNVFLVNDGHGFFTDATAGRLPSRFDVTQDLELGDVDGDGDLDLLVGNEDGNRLLINDGEGRFTDESADRLAAAGVTEETREAELGDVDGDGDLDIVFGNVRSSIPTADPANRLLINDGSGRFTNSVDRLPRDQDRTFDVELIDVDEDGDLDLVTSNLNATPGVPVPVRWRVFENDGGGTFRDATAEIFPDGVVGFGFDVESGDLDGDERIDLYLVSRGSADRLLFGRR